MAPPAALPADPSAAPPLPHAKSLPPPVEDRPAASSPALQHQASLPASLQGRSSTDAPKSPNGYHHLPISPPSHAFKVKASEQFDKSGLLAVQNASLHDAQVLEMGLHTLVVSNPEAKGATFGEDGLVLEPPKVQDPPAGLKPILLKDMKIGKYHRGRVLHGKFCTKPVKVRSLTTILEDDSGSAIIVLIPKAVPVSCSVTQAERQFPEGARVAIRHPYLRRFADKVLGILIEDPQDLIFLFIPETGHGTDQNGDNGERQKYYTDDWQRQVGTVGKEHFSIPAGDQPFSGSDEDEQDIKGGDIVRKVIDIEQHDAGNEKRSGDNAGNTPDKAQTGSTLAHDILEENGGSGPGDKPSVDEAVGVSPKEAVLERKKQTELSTAEATKGVLQVNRPQIAPSSLLLQNGGPGPERTSNGKKGVEGKALEIGRQAENGAIAKAENEDSIQRAEELERPAICGRSGGVEAEVEPVTDNSITQSLGAKQTANMGAVAEVEVPVESCIVVSLASSPKKVSDTREVDKILEDQKNKTGSGSGRLQSGDLGTAKTLIGDPRGPTGNGQDILLATHLGGASGKNDQQSAESRAAAGDMIIEPNHTTQDVLLKQKGPNTGAVSLLSNGVSSFSSSKGTAGKDKGLESSHTNGLQSINFQMQSEEGKGGNLVLVKSLTTGVHREQETPPRGYDSGEDLFEYDFKEANIRTTNASDISSGMATGGGQRITSESGKELLPGGELLSNGKGGLHPSGSSEEAENGTQQDTYVTSTYESEGIKMGTEKHKEATSNDGLTVECNKLPVSDSSIGVEKDTRPLISEDSHKHFGVQGAETAFPQTPSSDQAEPEEHTEKRHASDISAESSAKPTSISEGRKETLTLLSIQLKGHPESEAVQERVSSSSAKEVHVPGIEKEGKAGAEVEQTSERQASPVSSPVIPPNISAYALRVQGNRWFGQGDWKKAVSFYTWGIRQALKEHKTTVSASNMDLKKGLSSKKKNVQAASSDAYPSGGRSGPDTTIRTSKVEVAYPEEETFGVSAATASPRTYTEVLLGFSNRAEAWLRLHQYEKSLIDSERALELDSQHLKSIFRKGRALLGLGEYSEALIFLQAARNRASSDKDLQEAFQTCQTGDKQSRLGVFDLSEYFLKDRPSGSAKVPHCADYVGPVSVEHFGGDKGYGLVISRDVEAGSLLLVSNPLVFVADSSAWSDPLSSLRSSSSKAREKLASVLQGQVDATTRNLERILALCHADVAAEKLIKGMTDVPAASLRVFTQAGKAYDSFYASAATKLPLQQQLDSARISRIIRHNAFDRGTLRIQIGSGEQDEGPDAWEEIVEAEESADHGEILKEEPQRDEQVYGIWSSPSFINHSCLPNTSWILVGKTLFVVASRDLVAGEEITFNYFDVLQPLAERRTVSKSGWGFVCTCPRCSLEDRVDSHLQEVKNLYSLKQPDQDLAEDSEVDFVVSAELEKVFDTSLQHLTVGEQNWIRASFLRHHLTQLEGRQKDRKQIKLTSDSFAYLSKFLEALESVSPGSMETMRVSVVARELAKRSNGKKSASYRLANTSCLRICRCTYGKQKTNVLQALVTECRESLARLDALS